MKARVTVYPRAEVLDPQGQAVRQALQRLGFTAVREVRVGKSFDIELTAASAAKAEALLREMSEKLLANPVVEDFRVEIVKEKRG